MKRYWNLGPILGASVIICGLLTVDPRQVQSGLQQRPKAAVEPVYRVLTDDEVREIARVSDILVTRIRPRNQNEAEEDAVTFQGKRIDAAQALGEKLGDPWCMPALLAVLRDATDDATLRQFCLESLAQIPDRRVVDYLLDAMLDDNADIAGRAAYWVHDLTGKAASFDPKAEKAVREKQVSDVRYWWKTNRDRMRLRRR